MAAQLVLSPDPPPLETPKRSTPAPAPEPVGRLDRVSIPVPPPYAGPAAERREPIARGPFYVSTLDWTAQSYSIARYEHGRPQPYGALAAVRVDASKRCPGLTSPSVTRNSAGTYFLYASERTCHAPRDRRVTVWTSPDGVDFQRRGRVRGAAIEAGYVVYDRGVFRAWYSGSRGELLYGESRDGLRFAQVGGPKGPSGDPAFVVKNGEEWFLAQSSSRDGHQVPTLLEFGAPRQPRYREVGFDVSRRGAGARVAARASRGQRSLELSSTRRVKPGDLIVVPAGSVAADAAQVERVDGRTVRLRTSLRASHRPGDDVELAGGGSVAPSYMCRESDGSWAGMFTVYQALPSALYEITLVYRADSIRGPWRVDRGARAPILALENEQRRRAVLSPTPVTRGPAVRRCDA